MSASVRELIDFALLQSAAESYMDDISNASSESDIWRALTAGNNHPELIGKLPTDSVLSGATRCTLLQAQWFTDNYQIIEHYPNDASGFSCTLFRNKQTGEYTLSFRSTEYAVQELGGDWERDGANGADGDISSIGFALGQLFSMENFYKYLREGKVWNNVTKQWEVSEDVAAFADGQAVLNVTGYSLGAHLATAFTLLHWDAVANTYTFNAAGVGGIGPDNGQPTGSDIAFVLHMYETLMDYRPGDPEPDEMWWKALAAGSSKWTDYLEAVESESNHQYAVLYDNPLYQIVRDLVAPFTFPVGASGMGQSRLINAAANWATSTGDGVYNHDPNRFTSDYFSVDAWSGKIHQVYGHGEFFDPEIVANSGYHATPESIWIEDLPASRQLGFLEFLGPWIRDWVGDFGETHSITPLVDSLMVLDLLQTIDPELDMPTYVGLVKVMGHSQYLLESNSLAALISESVDALLQSLGLSPSESNLFFEDDRLYDPDAIENLLNALSKVISGVDPGLSGDYTASGYSNLVEREAVHATISDLKETLASIQGAGLISLVGMSADDMAEKATRSDSEGPAFRFAVSEFVPFVITGIQYGGALELYDPETGEGTLSKSYLQDRAAMLWWKLLYDGGKHDSDDMVRRPGDKIYSETWNTGLPGNWDYLDCTSPGSEPLALKIDGAGISLYDHQIIFGGAHAENREGSGDSDHLYGMAGNDTLSGGGGADYLEGGIDDDDLNGGDGADTLDGGNGDDQLAGGTGNDWLQGGAGSDRYTYRNGDGLDVIDDRDGAGSILLDGRPLTLDEAEKTGFDLWRSADKQYEFIWSEPDKDGKRDLHIVASSENPALVSLIIRDFRDGDLGLTLPDNQAAVAVPATPETEIVGDRAPVDADPNLPGVQTKTDDLGNVVTDSKKPEPGRQDTLFGSDGIDEFLSGLGGNDRLEGKGGKDVLAGGEDRDNLLGGSGNDILFGADKLDLNGYVEFLEFGGGTVDGTYGDFLSAEAGNDTLVGSEQSDALMGGEGEDLLIGGAGHDVLFGDATYKVVAPEFAWTVRGQPQAFQAADQTAPGFGNGVGLANVDGQLDTPEGGRDRIYGGSGGDWIISGRGDDIVYGESGMDAIDGGGGGDRLFGGDDDDSVFGDASARTLSDHGNDYIDLGPGVSSQSARGNGGDDTVLGGATADLLEGDEVRSGLSADYHGNDWIDGKGGSDTIYGEGEADRIYGGDGDDVIRGDSSSVQIGDPFQGDDYIEGGIGNDRIAGDGGRDTIYGGAGGDLLFGDASDVNAAVQGDDALYGEAGDDQLQGGGGNDALAGGAGADLLFGQAGEDRLDGGSENDELQGGDGSDSLNGGTGNDRIFGQAGDDFVAGGEGDDIVLGESGADSVNGGAGSDALYGGPGSDTLSGGAGADIYYYNVGDGVDVISDSVEAAVTPEPGVPSGVRGNSLQFGGGIVRADISLDVGSLVIKLADGGAVHIAGFDPSRPLANPVIDTFVFADGSHVDLEQLVAQGFDIVGSADGDLLQGTALTDRMSGLAGDDFLWAGAGDDRLDGGNGNDALDGGSGDDELSGGPGDDVYRLESRGDRVIEAGAGGVDTVRTTLDGYRLGEEVENLCLEGSAIAGSGNLLANRLTGNALGNRLSGEAGDDILDGGEGEDWLAGGTGDDGYVFGPGYGADRAADAGGEGDRVLLAAEVGREDLVFNRSGDDVIIGLGSTNDRLVLQDWYRSESRIESIVFADGSVLDAAAIESLIQWPPLAIVDDAAAVTEDTAMTISGNVLDNDGGGSGASLVVVDPGEFAGTYGRVTLGADGSYRYGLNNEDPVVQALAQGQTVTDRFFYTAADGDPTRGRQGQGELVVIVSGTNDVPLAADDFAAATEDDAAAGAGNVLGNDSDADAGSLLTVASSGSFAGFYGSLTMAEDGDYRYVLDQCLDAVQALAAGEQVSDRFPYAVTDGLATAQAVLELRITGSNDAPQLLRPLVDHKVQAGSAFRIVVPAGSFADPDHGDSLALSASGAGGGALPGWLSFDPATGSFSGSAPAEAGASVDLTVVARDGSGLAVSGGFRLSVAAASEAGIETIGTRHSELLCGSAGNDRLSGMGGRDWLLGKGGSDWLDGGSGNDVLWGQDGNDLLRGGAGADLLIGGAGADAFDLRGEAGSSRCSRDRLADFAKDVGNRTELDHAEDWSAIDGDILLIDFAELARLPGIRLGTFSRFGEGGFTTLADGELTSNSSGRADGPQAQFVFNASTGLLSFDPDGTGLQPAVPVVLIGYGGHHGSFGALSPTELAIAA